MYTRENFTDEEISILDRYFTNVDKPVFVLINLPEVVKGALFARYSRSSKSLRRLFLDEFYSNTSNIFDGNIDKKIEFDSTRAEKLYDRVFSEYGDDSVAQLGAAHVACEQSSNVLTKILERGRLSSYLEQSTRYIFYDKKNEVGNYNYYIPEEIRGQKIYQKDDKLYGEGKTVVTTNIQAMMEKNFQNTKKSKSVYNYSALATGVFLNYTIFKAGDDYQKLLNIHLLLFQK